MTPSINGKQALDAMRESLADSIRADIADAIKQHPQLSAQGTLAAERALLSQKTAEDLIRDLADEEISDAIGRGVLPGAAMIHLAGYKQNPAGEC